jgi:hypothetical protein
LPFDRHQVPSQIRQPCARWHDYDHFNSDENYWHYYDYWHRYHHHYEPYFISYWSILWFR